MFGASALLIYTDSTSKDLKDMKSDQSQPVTSMFSDDSVRPKTVFNPYSWTQNLQYLSNGIVIVLLLLITLILYVGQKICFGRNM